MRSWKKWLPKAQWAVYKLSAWCQSPVNSLLFTWDPGVMWALGGHLRQCPAPQGKLEGRRKWHTVGQIKILSMHQMTSNSRQRNDVFNSQLAFIAWKMFVLANLFRARNIVCSFSLLLIIFAWACVTRHESPHDPDLLPHVIMTHPSHPSLLETVS